MNEIQETIDEETVDIELGEVGAVDEQPPAITPMQMLQIAVEKGADLDKLSALMDLQERWEANQARKAYVVALNEFKASPPEIRKNKRTSFESRNSNSTVEYEYLTLPEAVRFIAPALSTHGLSHSWSVDQNDKRVSVTCTLTHRMGHSEKVTLSAPMDDSGKKNAIQAIGSTVTYLERYSLLAITGLSADEMDTDADLEDVETISEEQTRALEDLIDASEANIHKFLAYMNVEKLADITVDDYPRGFNMLEAKRAEQ